jgi:hypothetical protein
MPEYDCANPACLQSVFEEGEFCEECRREKDWLDWLEATLDAVERFAKQHGWDFNRHDYSGGFNTPSRYYELTRLGGEWDADNEEYLDIETLKLRLSDHGTCYCSEDISLAMNASGDDSTLEALGRRMARPFDAD